MADAASTTLDTNPQTRQLPPQQKSLIKRMAERFAIDADRLLHTLKSTAFRQRPDKKGNVPQPTNEEMMVLLAIAEQYNLNPFTKEIFAYLDPKSGAIIPIVSVDGWLRIINERPELQKIEFEYSAETKQSEGKTVHLWMECTITRSDRGAPITVREFFDEVVRVGEYTPWKTHPNRMMRHKVLIQCARVAFGFAGLHDPDEGARIIEGEAARQAEQTGGLEALNNKLAGPAADERKALEYTPGETLPSTRRFTAEATVTSSAEIAARNAQADRELDATLGADRVPPAGPDDIPDEDAVTFEYALTQIQRAGNRDSYDVAIDLINSVKDPAHQAMLRREAGKQAVALKIEPAGGDGD